MGRTAVVCVCVFAAMGCKGVSSNPAYMASEAYQQRPKASASLFASDAAEVDVEAIGKLLDTKVVIPTPARMMVIRLDQPRHPQWESGKLALKDHGVQAAFIGELRKCKRLMDVAYLPPLLSPDTRTIPHFRQAAARCQADLILVYRAQSRIRTRDRILARDQAKALCTVEALLVDTRTGIVLFTSMSVQEHIAKKSDDDFDFSETSDRAQTEAVGQSLAEIGSDLAAFMDVVP